MNNEQQELLSEAYENYCTTLIGSITFSERGKHFKSDGLEFNSGYPNYVHYTKEEFINKCKTNTEFSERWGLQIEERELSEEERWRIRFDYYPKDKQFPWDRMALPSHRFLDDFNIPTRAITITYNDKTIESYE
jgi:hypothetical protein